MSVYMCVGVAADYYLLCEVRLHPKACTFSCSDDVASMFTLSSRKCIFKLPSTHREPEYSVRQPRLTPSSRRPRSTYPPPTHTHT